MTNARPYDEFRGETCTFSISVNQLWGLEPGFSPPRQKEHGLRSTTADLQILVLTALVTLLLRHADLAHLCLWEMWER